MKLATQVQVLDEAHGISYNASIFWKGMNPVILLPTIGK